KRSTFRAEHQTDSQVRHANTALSRRGTGGFPVPTDLCEKTPTDRARFVLLCVAALSVEAGRRCAGDHSWRPLQPGEPFGEKPRSRDAAVTDRRFPLFVPAPREDTLACEMNDRVGAFGGGRVEATRRRIPKHAIGRPPHEPLDGIAARSK